MKLGNMSGGCLIVVLLLAARLGNAQDGDAVLDQCEAAGFRAGSFAYRAACLITKSSCPPKQTPPEEEDDEFLGRTLFTDGLVAEVIRSSCQLLFKGSCEASAFETALEKDPVCADLFFNGPEPVPQCPDLAAAVQIFSATAARLCDQKPPPFKPAPQPKPEAEIKFKATGNSGKEIITTVKLITKQNRVRLAGVKCSETGDGKMTTSEQECIAYVPADIPPGDVQQLKIVLGNPVTEEGQAEHTIEITDGKVWFLGRNIWRSAIDATVASVHQNNNGKLDALRAGSLKWNEGDMFSPPPTTSLWLEARGKSGKEYLKVTAKLKNGGWKGVPIRCTGTSTGQLQTRNQVCTAHYDGSPSEVELLVFEFEDLGVGSDVLIKDGRVMFFGVNVWWKANSSLKDDISRNVDGRLWQLRAGALKWSGIIAPVDTSEYATA